MKKILILVVISCHFIMAQQVKFFRTYGSGIFDSGEGVLQMNDTGYAVCGITSQSGSNGTDVMLYKTDSLGVLQWYKNIGVNNSIEGAHSIASGRGKTEYLLAGYQNGYDASGYNFYAVKANLNGDTLWTRAYGGADWDMAYSVDTLQDSTYVMAGETYSFGNGNADMYVIRIDQNGDTLWTRTFGGTNDDYARYVFTDWHNNIVVVGSTSSFGAGGSDVYIVYLNALGDTIWTKAYGTAVDEYGYSGDMFINNGGTLTFAFSYTQFNPVSSLQESRFFRADSASCALMYDYNWFFSQPEILDHPKMRKDGKGKFYITGDIRYSDTGPTDVYLHRTNYGIVFSTTQQIVFVTDFQYPHDVRKCYDKGLVITGSTTFFGPGPTTSFIMKTDSVLTTPTNPVVAVEDYAYIPFDVYPNPVTQNLAYINAVEAIQLLRLVDMNGRVVQTITGQGNSSQSIVINDLPAGIYILEVITATGTGRKKLMITH